MDTVPLDLVLQVLWEVLGHLHVIHQQGDSSSGGILEAAECDSGREVIMVAHLVVEWDGDVRRFSGTHVEDSSSEVLSWVSASLVVVSDLHKQSSPLVVVLRGFDSSVFKNNVTMLLKMGLIPSEVMHLELLLLSLWLEGIDVWDGHARVIRVDDVLELSWSNQWSLLELGSVLWFVHYLLSLSPCVKKILSIPSLFRYLTSISLLVCELGSLV